MATAKAKVVPITGARQALPSGAWVEIRDPMEITHGQWTDTIKALPDTATLDDLAMAVSIAAWSYDLPVPTAESTESIRDIPQADASALGATLIPVLRMLHPDFSASLASDPESPSEPSAG